MFCGQVLEGHGFVYFLESEPVPELNKYQMPEDRYYKFREGHRKDTFHILNYYQKKVWVIPIRPLTQIPLFFYCLGYYSKWAIYNTYSWVFSSAYGQINSLSSFYWTWYILSILTMLRDSKTILGLHDSLEWFKGLENLLYSWLQFLTAEEYTWTSAKGKEHGMKLRRKWARVSKCSFPMGSHRCTYFSQ